MSVETVISIFVCLVLWTALSSGIAYFLARAFFGKPGRLDQNDDDL